MSIVEARPLDPMVGDPDDHRPASMWGLKVDLGDENGRVDSLAITILSGQAETRLGDERRHVSAGTVIFIPAGTPHGTANAGDEPLQIHAVFPATSIEIAMLERNPAPGTEADTPRRNRCDLRTGSFEAIE